MNIRNRIKELRVITPDEVAPNPRNWRVHPQAQRDALRGVLADVGIAAPVIVYHSEHHSGLMLIDGHERMTVGVPFPAVILDVTDAEAATLLATFDPLGAMAETDPAALDALLRDVTTDSPAVAAMLDELAQSAGIVPSLPEPGQGGDEFDTTPDATGPTRCQMGDLWIIGGVHRLIIGDSTDPATVARLMDGERAGAIFTSPPYDQQRTYEGNMAADWLALMRGVFGVALSHLAHDAQVFINLGLVHRNGRVVRYWDDFIVWMENAAQAWPLFGWYVWDKLNGMPGDWNGRLAPAHEWVFHFTKESVKPEKTVKNKYAGEIRDTATQRTNDGGVKNFSHIGKAVQEFRIPDSVIRTSPHKARGIEIEHPAVFPVALPEMFMNAYAASLWLEPFCGSGTSIIAAHRTGRRCYGVEIEPRYGDVIFRRAEAEGLTLECIADA